MTPQSRPVFSLSRLSVIGAFALFGLATASAAAAPPLTNDGGSGSSSAESSMMIEELGLVPTNGGIGSFTMEQAPVLVGSGADREIVANSNAQESAGTLNESERSAALIDLTDGNETAGTLDETARSADLIALSPVPATFETAVIQHGQPY